MVGGHQAKAMPTHVLNDPRFARLEALVLGEGETRVAELLCDRRRRFELPGVMWRDPVMKTPVTGGSVGSSSHLTPDINALPFVDRRFFADDPYRAADGRLEANMVGARGCPYNCSFCGAAVSANPDITIRTREPGNIIEEMDELHATYGVTAFRFVDDLFLGYERFIRCCMDAFTRADIGSRYVWDATGRINILHRASDGLLDVLAQNGCREVALGIESGSERLLGYMGKRITPAMTRSVVERLTARGIGIKGYFILGFPTETREELEATVRLVYDLWDIAERRPSRFRASVFEFRPYPGTPEWDRLIATGNYDAAQLLDYTGLDWSNCPAHSLSGARQHEHGQGLLRGYRRAKRRWQKHGHGRTGTASCRWRAVCAGDKGAHGHTTRQLDALRYRRLLRPDPGLPRGC